MVDTAFRLAHARNKAVHTAPELELDVTAVIADLVDCLNNIPYSDKDQ